MCGRSNKHVYQADKKERFLKPLCPKVCIRYIWKEPRLLFKILVRVLPKNDSIDNSLFFLLAHHRINQSDHIQCRIEF